MLYDLSLGLPKSEIYKRINEYEQLLRTIKELEKEIKMLERDIAIYGCEHGRDTDDEKGSATTLLD